MTLPGNMRYILMIGAQLLLLTVFSSASPTFNESLGKPKPPNIIVIMSDDHGQWASPVYGNTDFTTPNMSWMANHGVVFKEAYAVSPVCSPARASFFTGRMPSQHGIHDFISESPEFEQPWLENEILLSELLQNAGFKTALVGKWHLSTNSAVPQRGFDFWYSYDVAPEGWQNQYHHRGVVHFSKQGEPVKFEGFQSEELTTQAIDFMNRSKNEAPFFLFLGLVDTHAPFNGQPETLVDKIRGGKLNESSEDSLSSLPAQGEASVVPADHEEQLIQYYAAVQMMDRQIGRIIAYLRSEQLLRNTLIIYTSDHGHMNDHHGLYGKGNATIPQNFFQESILSPLIMTWPNHIESREKMLMKPVSTCDIFQTILEAAQVELSTEQAAAINSPGHSVFPILQDAADNWSSYKYVEYGNARMISDNRYKYVLRMDPVITGFGDEFYDLQIDPGENTNLIDQPDYRDQIRLLQKKLEEFFAQYQEPHHSGANLLQQPPANGNEIWR